MPEKPLYQGARPNLGEGIHPLAIPTTGLQAAEESNKRFASALDSAANRFFQLQDFGQQQKLEGQIREETAKFDREFLRRANLAPGATGSLYTQDGRLNENALDDLVFEYSGRIEQIHRHFINPEKAIEAEALRQENIERLKTRAFGQAAQQEITNVRRNFEDNLRLSLSTRDYPGAISSIDRAVDDGLITSTNAEARKQGIRHDATWENAQILLATDPDELNRQLNDGTFNGTLSPLEQENLRKGLARQRAEKEKAFFNSFILTKGKGTKGIEFTGYVTKRQAEWFNAVAAGDFANVERAITSGAIEEAACAPVGKSPQEWEEWKAHYLRVYEALGMDKTFLNQQLKAAEERNKQLDHVAINPATILDVAQNSGLLYNDQRFGEVAQPYNDDALWEAGGELRIRYKGKYGITDKDSANIARYKFKQHYLLPQHAAELRSQVIDRWTAWQGTPDGQSADVPAQQEKLQSIIRDVTGNKGYTLVDPGNGIAQTAQESRTAQNNRYIEWVRRQNRHGEKLIIEPHPLDSSPTQPEELQLVPFDTRTPAGPPTFTAPLGFDSDRNLPEGILIPEERAKGLDTSKLVVDVTFDNKHYRRFRVVGTCKGKAPRMTHAVADGDLRDPKRIYNANYQIISGNPDELMQVMGVDDGLVPENKLFPEDDDTEEAVPMSDAPLPF